jgi:hypothetical protein
MHGQRLEQNGWDKLSLRLLLKADFMVGDCKVRVVVMLDPTNELGFKKLKQLVKWYKSTPILPRLWLLVLAALRSCRY